MKPEHKWICRKRLLNKRSLGEAPAEFHTNFWRGKVTSVHKKNAAAFHEDRHVDSLFEGRGQGKHSTLVVKSTGHKNTGK